jgi:hypothetical protein
LTPFGQTFQEHIKGKYFSFNFNLLENWTVYLFVLQEELRSVAKYLSLIHNNSKIEKYIKVMWFDLLESTHREEILFLSIFTAEKMKFGTEFKIAEKNNSAFVKRIESNLLKEAENKTGGAVKINYDRIFGDSQLMSNNFGF